MGSEHREQIAEEPTRRTGELPKREALLFVEPPSEAAAALNVLGDSSSAVSDGDGHVEAPTREEDA
jgi:hypothetical protein